MLVTGSSEVSNALSNYTISNSLRFQAASSQYATRTPASASNRQTWTWSGWVKRGIIDSGASQYFLFSAYTASTDAGYTAVYLSADQLSLSGWNTVYRKTTQVFRDPSAWYHVVVVWDSSQSTASNRIKIYVNGSQVTAFATSNDPTSSQTSGVNSAGTHTIGANSNTLGVNNFDGYQTEINFIDGQALTPSSFGATNPYTGQWQAQKYTGTYGTNGFYLPFSNGTSTTTLGTDSSGNNNNWTLTNFTRSAGVSDCWMYDVPSGNGSPSATQPSSNYAVLNPLDLNAIKYQGTSSIVLTKANLTIPATGSGYHVALSSVGVNSGNWYWESTISATPAGSNNTAHGLVDATTSTPLFNWFNGGSGTAFVQIAGVTVASGASYAYTTNDVLGIAINTNTGAFTLYKNNSSVYTSTYTATSNNVFAFFNTAYDGSLNANFGQRSFAYTPPTGFVALCTANLPASTAPIVAGNKFMDATTYSGNSTIQNVTNAGAFSPDLVWIKNRSGATDHILNDTVRGAGNYLISNLTNAEATNTTIFSAFNSNGFQVNNAAQTNSSGSNYVAWQWKAGGTPATTNTDGSIASVVSVNRNSGFSIVTFTSTGSAGAVTVGHGLGVAPAMVITKERGAVGSWGVYHKGLATPASQYLNLQTTSAATTNTSYWGNTNPSSTVVTLGNGTMMALNTTMVMYCFAEIAGFSRFGSYTGNGSTDGPFIYKGFRPKYIMIKNSSAAYSWYVEDTSRATYNAAGATLAPNTSATEDTVWGSGQMDILSNGFKIRISSAESNANGNTFIYAAFAENPFQYANAR